MTRFRVLLLAVLMGGCTVAPPTTYLEQYDLAPTGTLRIAVFTGNPVIGSPSALRGEPIGTTATLGKELAVQARVPSRVIEYNSVAKLVEDAKAGVWDITVLAYDPARRGVLEFAPPHMVVDMTDRSSVAEMCLVLPKGRTAALDYVAEFVLRSKQQGLVARAIEQSGLRGVRVAP